MTGTTTSLSSSFKVGFDISATLGSKAKDSSLSGSGGLDFGYSNTTTNTSSLDLKKSASTEISVSGPGADGINHDEDLIYLWLNPQVNITVDPRNNLNWELDVNGPLMTIQFVHVGWLKNPGTMPPALQQRLSAAGLTAADYANILAVDPFASGATAIDPNRFAAVNFTFPYNPPLNATDPVPVMKYNLTNSATYGTGTSTQTQTSASLLGSIASAVGSALKASLQLQWTNISSSGTTNQTTQSATAAIGGPAYGFSGPSDDIEVYWDTVYNSFMFAFVATSASLTGVMKDSSGSLLANTEVEVTAGGKTFKTVTNAKGEYRFYRTGPGAGAVSVVPPTLSLNHDPILHGVVRSG